MHETRLISLLFDGTGVFELIIECTEVQFSALPGLNGVKLKVTFEVLVGLPDCVDSLKHIDTVTLLLSVPIKLSLLV